MALTAEDFATVNDTGVEVKTAEEMGNVAPVETVVEVKTETAVETPAAEVKVETAPVVETTETKTEVKAEEKAAETTTSLFDKFKNPAAPTEVVVEAKAEEKPVIENDTRVAELEEKLKNYDNALVGLLGGDYDLTNVDIPALLKGAVGEDYSGLSTESLIEKSLNGDPDFQALSEEDRKEEIELRLANLANMSKFEAQKERTKLLGELNKAADPSKLVEALEKVKEGQKNAISDPDKWYEEKVTSEFADKFETTKTEISNLAKQLVGQDYNGFKVTEEVATQIAKEFEDQTLNFDTEKVAFNLFKIAAFDKAVEEAEKRGYEKAVKEKTNPSAGDTTAKPIFKDEKKGMQGMTAEDWQNVQL